MPPVLPAALRHYLESGLRAQAEGDWDAAASAYQAALRLAPEYPDALNLMGTALLQLGDTDAAVDHLQRAARKMKNHPGVHATLGQACFAAGRHEQAREAFRRASRLDPGNVNYRLGTATALAAQGRFAEAETLLRKQAREFAGAAPVWLNLGNVLRDLGRPAEALDCFVKTLALDPQRIDARNGLGCALRALQRIDEAEREFRACIATAPEFLLPQMNLASLLIDIGRFGEAEALLRRIIERAPEQVEAHLWLGAALSHLGRLRDALPCYRTATTLAPNDAGAALAYAELLMENGSITAGLRWYARACNLTGGAHAADSLGDALLGAGLYAEGWAAYVQRPYVAALREQLRVSPLMTALPERLDGKHVCLVNEQGLGDEIFFLRFSPELRARGARITYHASAKLCSMLARTDGLDAVIGENAPLPAADVTMLIGDLPHALHALPATSFRAICTPGDKTAIREFAQHTAVFWPALPPSIALEPLAEQVARMRGRLAHAGLPPYLGITWRAGTPPQLQQGEDWALHKSIPVTQLAAALRDFRGTLIALQRRPAAAEIDTLSSALAQTVHDFTAMNEDLEGMLALLSLIDEYVGVSNTNMHLRAAAGRSARVLVPCPAEWRWMACGRESPWFPGFSVYRQGFDGDWMPALAALAADLSRGPDQPVPHINLR